MGDKRKTLASSHCLWNCLCNLHGQFLFCLHQEDNPLRAAHNLILSNGSDLAYGVAPTNDSAYKASSYPGWMANALRQFSTALTVSPVRYKAQPCHSHVSSDISVR